MKLKKIKQTTSAVTLTELIVAAVIGGVVMVSAVSVDLAFKGLQSNVSTRTPLIMKATGAMLKIERTLLLATGWPSDPGVSIQENYAGGLGKSLCIRRDTDNDAIGDEWVCFWQANQNPEIHTCVTGALPGFCSISDKVIGTSIARVENNGGVEKSPSGFQYDFVVNTAVTPTAMYIDLRLTDRADPTKAVSASNPEYTLQTRVFPQGHSSI